VTFPATVSKYHSYPLTEEIYKLTHNFNHTVQYPVLRDNTCYTSETISMINWRSSLSVILLSRTTKQETV